jgi:hypothetical protein
LRSEDHFGAEGLEPGHGNRQTLVVTPLDAEGLRAGASAALAAPDREIRIEVGKDLVAAEAAEVDAA